MKTFTLTIPWFNQVLILVLSTLLYLLMTSIVYTNGKAILTNKFKEIQKTWILISLYLGFCLFLSYLGFLESFTFPPRMPLLSVSITLFSLYLIVHSPLYDLLKKIGPAKIALFQIWRFIPESVIFLNVFTGIQPEIMTITGRNYDLLVPISAPIIYWLSKQNFIQSKWLLYWNVGSLLILLHTLSVGVLSAPFPIQKYDVYPSNAVVGFFPMTLIPLFFVPLAITSHWLGIMMTKRQEH